MQQVKHQQIISIFILYFGFFVHLLPLYIYSAFLLILSALTLHAEDITIRIPDSLLSQGARIRLPILIQTSEKAKLESCSIRVGIPKRRIILHDVVTEPGTLFTCKKPQIIFLSDGEVYKEYSIQCVSPLFDSTGILCFLDIEVLAGRDSIAFLQASSFSIGNTQQTIRQIGGSLTFNNPPITQASSEGMDINAPNPFAYTTTFTYYLGKSGFVQFSLFNTQGKLIKEFPEEQRAAGRHMFTLDVDNPLDFSSGVYIIRMSTQQGIYHMSMVHKK